MKNANFSNLCSAFAPMALLLSGKNLAAQSNYCWQKVAGLPDSIANGVMSPKRFHTSPVCGGKRYTFSGGWISINDENLVYDPLPIPGRTSI